MSQSFYSNVQVFGSKILYRGVENGRRIIKKIEYHPTLFLSSKDKTPYTTIHDEYVSEIKPGNIRDCRSFVDKYKDVENFKIYGNQRYEYAFIADEFGDDINWDRQHISVCNIDIEVGSDNGFPDPTFANETITAITMRMNNRFIVLGCGEFDNTRNDVEYHKCQDEFDLIKRFIHFWSVDYPDIITGWNVKFFDIPYLVNRIRNLFGEDEAKKLSPWKVLNERSVFIMGREQKAYLPLGIAIYDYMELYKKFAPGGYSQESYKLDAICHNELGERKLSYEEYGNLHNLYKENYQRFIEYNIKDTELVEKLDDKLKLIDLALTLAYDSKSNYEDVFAQVRMWDNITFNELKKHNKVIPPIERHRKDAAYVGAYVKDPKIGKHNWVVSFDLTSLYPHLIMQYNVSPDKFVDSCDYTDDIRKILTSGIDVDNLLNREVDLSKLKSLGVTLTPNGQFFRVDKQGFLASIMENMYNDRAKYKKKAIEAKKELEKESDPDKRVLLEKDIARFNNLQLAKKVSLNSAYGALGSEFFRFFDIRQATAITTSGQLSIRWIERKLNGYLNKLLNTNDRDYVIASDTDSVYLDLDELVRRTIREKSPTATTEEVIVFLDAVCKTKIQPFIDKSYTELAEYTNALAQKMFMKREAIADKGIWTAKKRYILNVWDNEGVRYTIPKAKVMGLEMIKSSTPAACRKKLWESIDVMLNENEEVMIDFINTFRKEFSSLPEGDIAFPRGVNGIKDYTDKETGSFSKGTPIHVRGSIVYNRLITSKKLNKKYETIKDGDKIKFIYLKEPNTIQSNVISFSQVLPKELDIHKYIDYDVQYEKSFLEPLKIILDCIGWKTEKTSSLEDFFS